jgi:hypothetical protein
MSRDDGLKTGLNIFWFFSGAHQVKPLGKWKYWHGHGPAMKIEISLDETDISPEDAYRITNEILLDFNIDFQVRWKERLELFKRNKKLRSRITPPCLECEEE